MRNDCFFVESLTLPWRSVKRLALTMSLDYFGQEAMSEKKKQWPLLRVHASLSSENEVKQKKKHTTFDSLFWGLRLDRTYAGYEFDHLWCFGVM